MVIDDFLNGYKALRQHCNGLDYSGYVSPVDGVEYPGISGEVPEDTQAEILASLCLLMQGKIVNPLLFFRLSVNGVKAPHGAHNDSSMGQYALFIYLNKPEHCQGGTSFVKHIKGGFNGDLSTPEELALWKQDTHNYDAWEVEKMAKMKPNRAVVFESANMHRAEPAEGFGDDASNGRLVLICFFGIEHD